MLKQTTILHSQKRREVEQDTVDSCCNKNDFKLQLSCITTNELNNKSFKSTFVFCFGTKNLVKTEIDTPMSSLDRGRFFKLKFQAFAHPFDTCDISEFDTNPSWNVDVNWATLTVRFRHAIQPISIFARFTFLSCFQTSESAAAVTCLFINYPHPVLVNENRIGERK